jgi:hypothetical protein
MSDERMRQRSWEAQINEKKEVDGEEGDIADLKEKYEINQDLGQSREQRSAGRRDIS